MKIGPNKDINKVVVYQKKLPVTPPESSREQVVAHAACKRHFMKSTDNLIKETVLLTDNRKMLVEKYNESSHHTFTKTSLITYHFWWALTLLA